jgi:hypothetical protein
MNDSESKINEILRAEDIESLFQHGAPEDEYSHEAHEIASKLTQIGSADVTEESVMAFVRDVWVRSFGPFSEEDIAKRLPAFRQVAHRILNRT